MRFRWSVRVRCRLSVHPLFVRSVSPGGHVQRRSNRLRRRCRFRTGRVRRAGPTLSASKTTAGRRCPGRPRALSGHAMGAGPSHGELADNDCLLRLAGELEITVDDPFWDAFLTFSLNPPTCRCVLTPLGRFRSAGGRGAPAADPQYARARTFWNFPRFRFSARTTRCWRTGWKASANRWWWTTGTRRISKRWSDCCWKKPISKN